MSKCLSLALYFISYLPLWISVLFIDIKSLAIDKTCHPFTEEVSIPVIIIVMLVSALYTFAKMAPSGHENTIEYEIKEEKEQKTATIDFLLSYTVFLFSL